MPSILFRLIVILCFTPSCFAASSWSTQLTKKRVLFDLDAIGHFFDVKYAPKNWKETYANWDLEAALRLAKSKIEDMPALKLKECQFALRDFFTSARDYHAGIRFYSTEYASLPFSIRGAEGRYFFIRCPDEDEEISDFPFEIGDEIYSFNGQPIQQALDEIRSTLVGHNTLETDELLAENMLTERDGELGHPVPSGYVKITGKRKGESHLTEAYVKWRYIPERILDFSRLGEKMALPLMAKQSQKSESVEKKSSEVKQFFGKRMATYLWDKKAAPFKREMHKHKLGARISFIPTLGEKIWTTAQSESLFGNNNPFYAYIFQTHSGKQIGYIRIPHYDAEEEEAEEFGKLMNFFEKNTDALVIDQVNNPGGDVWYLYALASMLTDRPLSTPKHRIILTQEEVFIAQQLLNRVEDIEDDYMAQEALGATMGGYCIDAHFAKMTKEFCQFLLTQWEQGKLLSEPIHLFGAKTIKPHPEYHYSKPIVLLINSLDFSCGDFFPAIMQDNKRALVVGTRTAGAGGYVFDIEYPNQSGISKILLTGSIAERFNKLPIENLGVIPDIHLNLTALDLQENYCDYVSSILETIETLW